MKGIYISVPDSEFSFFMSMLGKFKHATVIKTDEFSINKEAEYTLLPWQIEEIKLALEDEKHHPNEGIEAKEFMKDLRNRRNV
jgi:hypothetical protein